MSYYLRYPSGYATISVDLDDLIKQSAFTTDFDAEGYIIYVESISTETKMEFQLDNVISDQAILGLHFVYPNINADMGGSVLPFFRGDKLTEYTNGTLAPFPENDEHYVVWAASHVASERINQSITLKITFDTSHPDFLDSDKVYRFHIKKLSIEQMACYESRAVVDRGYDIQLGGGVFSSRDVGSLVPNIYKYAIGIDFGNNSSSVCILSDQEPSPETLERELIIQEDSSISICKGELLNSTDTYVANSQDTRALFHSNLISAHSGRNALRCNIGKKSSHFVGESSEKDPFSHRAMKRSLAHPRSHDDLCLKQLPDLSYITQFFDKLGSFKCQATSKDKPFWVPPRIPAELYLTELFDKIAARPLKQNTHDCSKGRVGTPSNIVLTYPITYGLKEIIHYRLCFARAFLRHFNVLQPNPGSRVTARGALPAPLKGLEGFEKLIDDCQKVVDDPKIKNQDVPFFPVKGMIDEASAAAYYYIRKFMVNRKNFNLNGFHFQHPEGCRIVIIDCGAGTTDVAAFDVTPVFQGEKSAKRIVKVKVELKKRTGDNHFCGDFVTRQIIRLVKAKIIYANETAGNAGRKIPDADQHLGPSYNQGGPGAGFMSNPNGFVNAVYRYFNQSIKNSATRQELGFLDTENPHQKPDPRKAFIALKGLVELGENLKKEFNKPEIISQGKKNIYPTALGGMKGIGSIIDDYYSKAQDSVLQNSNVAAVKARLEKLTIHYEDLKKLIENDQSDGHSSGQSSKGGLKSFIDMVKTSIIFPVSEETDDFNEERFVSRVIVTGKGSLFRSIMDLFKENLGLLDPDTQLVNLSSLLNDPEQLKRCVSIGASWWLSDRTSPNALIDMDCERLQKVIPYSLGLELGNGFVVKVPVGTPYSDLNDKLDDSIVTNTPVKQIRLYKKFPGAKPAAFCAFEFSNPVTEFRIKWDKEAMEFVVGNAQKDTSFQGDEEQYGKSPMWDGTV